MTGTGVDRVLRPIAPGDHADVLAINERFVDLLSPLDAGGLDELVALADRADVIEHEGRFAGFVVTLAAGAAYDSENYRWFTDLLGQDFYYLDRVVLDPGVRRAGLGSLAYDELEARAAELASAFALEVNVDPPNEPSLAFHRRRGFAEVGRRTSHGHTVAMLVRRVDRPS